MEKLKFALFSIVTLSLVGLVGYWSVITLQSGSEYVKEQKIKQLEKENENLKTETKKLAAELSVLRSNLEEPASDVGKSPEVIVYKYQDLINDLQKLVDGKIVLKEKSKGERVGTVQNFLNIYNNTSSRVDNDFGVTTEKQVITFQKDSGLVGDGEVGSTTFEKMIDWLKKQV